MSDDDDKKPRAMELAPFGPEDDAEVRALQGKAEYVMAHGADYTHLRGQLDTLEEIKESIMLCDPKTVQYLSMSWFQLSEMVQTLELMTRGEHRLLKQLDTVKEEHRELLERLNEEHADDLERFTSKVLNCEREVREHRQRWERARVDFGIPDTYE
jgi:hypothetical protein